MKSGLIVLDKPSGLSSFAALSPVKRAVGKRLKVGHAGTLDPFATGVLLALIGDATRLSNLAMALPKTYEAVVRFGVATDTLDPDGEVTAEADPGAEPPDDLAAEVARFQGEIEQMPPAFSALKVDGKRAYKLARKGKEVTLDPRRVVVHEIRLAQVDWPFARLTVRCGAGTYIRCIARDLGAAIGLPASLSELRRTAIGPYTTEAALRIDPEKPASAEAIALHVVPSLGLIRAAGLPVVELSEQAARFFVAGLPAETSFDAAPRTKVATAHGELLLGLGEVDFDGAIRPTTVLASAQAAIRATQ